MSELASAARRPTLLTDVEALWKHAPGANRAVVMTMGALHPGHGGLFSEARNVVGPNGDVLVTIFVNPLQFGKAADLDGYPRTLEADLQICAEHGVDAVFAPSAHELYGSEPAQITVDPGDLGSEWEGAVRPDHFRGVLTVVLKLLNLTRPQVAVFGEKDYQQLVLVSKMVQSLNVPVSIHAAPTARADDGLALSSRNVFLSSSERLAARSIPEALAAGSAAAAVGATAREVVSEVEAVLAAGGVTPDYVVVRDLDLGVAPAVGRARLLVAAHVGGVHLLDNIAIDLNSRIEAIT
jgi:pantoate--beta-alanine ligase